MTNSDSSDGVALDRALTLLDAIVRDGGRASLSAHAAALGLPVSTAHRFVATLSAHGLLRRTRRGYYAGDTALAALGECAARAASIGERARPALAALSRWTNAAAHLGVLEGEMVTYLVKEDGGSGGIFTQEGAQLEAYCSAIGKVLLAELDDEACDAYLRGGPFVALTANTLTDPATMRAGLNRVREQGFALDQAEVADDLFCTAVPVRGPDGRVEAAVSLSVRASRPIYARPPHALLRCVREIEARLR